ncbi:MAG TPA: hypothetical protein H9742_08630, partial [Candidatus Acetatifactor stercoripullorum]|nr:hypothetical protein [Candidatus Acetatifactor stercoripullorum]
PGNVKKCLPYDVKICLPGYVKNSLPYGVKNILPNNVKKWLTFASKIPERYFWHRGKGDFSVCSGNEYTGYP